MPSEPVSVTATQAVGEEATHEDDLKKHFLIDLHELLVPLFNICRLLACI